MNALAGVEEAFRWLLETTWQGAVTVGIILLAQFLLRNRLSRAWRHGLWFLLVARLLMPTTPRSALSIFNLAKWPPPKPTAALAGPAPVWHVNPAAQLPVAPAEVQGTQPPGMPAIRPETIFEPHATISLPLPQAAAAKPAVIKSISASAVAAWIWAVGAIGLMLRFLILNERFRRRLGRHAQVSDAPLTQIFKECLESLQVRQRVKLIETEEVDSPAVYGLWRKQVLLPDSLREQLSTHELRHVLLHELAHVKRRDPELNWLLAALQIIHWFNPVLWYAFARMRADRELATDDLALAHTHQQDRTSYGETILKVLEGLTQPRVLPGLVGIGESKGQIKERIRAIARGSAGPRWRWAAGAVVAVIAGIALTNAREEGQPAGTDLLKRYPTTLKAGDVAPGRARPWQFTPNDIFQVSRFALEVGKDLKVAAGISDLGIGHCADGTVWAVLIPRETGKLTSTAATKPEPIDHIWLRFHPGQINRIFPPETITAGGKRELETSMRHIADTKIHSSWHAGDNAMIPEPKDMTVDVDTKTGPRRFFAVDQDAKTAEYAADFADSAVEPVTQAPYEPEVETNCARVVSVTPENGASEVELTQGLRLRFDRPMNPYGLKLECLSGGFQLNGSIQVSADRMEFTIPVRWTPGQEQNLVLNRDQERERAAAGGKRPGITRPGSSRTRGGFLDADAAPANEFRWSFTTKSLAAKAGTAKPRIVSASPASGTATPVLALVEVAFDQPMLSSDFAFPYLETRAPMGGPSLIPSFDYDASAHRFTFPALLRPDDDVRLTLKGFYSAAGMACEPVVLHYQAGTESIDAKYVTRAKAAAAAPKLQKLLGSMKEARARLHSGIETVQTIQLGQAKSAFNSLEAQTATFKWQGPDQVYADITAPMSMCKSFILGSDGRTCWLYSENEKGEKRLDQTPVATADQYSIILDPFGLANRSVQQTLAEAELVYASDATLEGRTCHRLEKWDVQQDSFVYATLTQWWIDGQTFLLKQLVQYSPNACQVVRFDYKELNQQLPPTTFHPPVVPGGDAHPLFFEQEPRPGERRFLRVSDGSNGRMSGRLGWRGPNGMTSSGLN
jgi:beta-lactamase regulating signal transducer with metallopeptidase domain